MKAPGKKLAITWKIKSSMDMKTRMKVHQHITNLYFLGKGSSWFLKFASWLLIIKMKYYVMIFTM